MGNGSRAWSLGVALTCCMVAGVALAGDDDSQFSYAPLNTEPGYQARPDSTGNVIGYKPIPTSALEAAIPGRTAAAAPLPLVPPPGVGPAGRAFGAPPPPAATPGGGMATPAVQAAIPANGTASAAAGTPSELPTVYITGVVGEGLYTLGRDDFIRIDVQNQPEFTGNFFIGFDGRIQYSYLGDIPVAGLTKYEVQQVLEKLLQKYVRVPIVNVTIIGYNSKVVYVIGEVGSPGKFIMRGDVIKLREAILAAGLPTPRAALSRVHVIKPDLNDPLVRVINLKRILYKGKLKDDVDLTAGEIVVVPSTVLSKVNDFLTALLSPVTRGATAARLATF